MHRSLERVVRGFVVRGFVALDVGVLISAALGVALAACDRNPGGVPKESARAASPSNAAVTSATALLNASAPNASAPNASGPASAAVASTRPTPSVLEPQLLPLEAPEHVAAFPVEGFRDAALALPRGITEPVPVIVALHGNYDRPEWQCETWADALPGPSVVLCPRGIPRAEAPRSEDRWTYASWLVVKREVAAALEQLEQRHGDYVDTEQPILLGFSLGAILGVRLLSDPGASYRRAVLIEGGYKGWSAGVAKRFRGNGGERVLFACGQAACLQASRGAASILERAGVEARVVSGGSVGHTYGGSVAAAVAEAWGFVTDTSAIAVPDAGSDAPTGSAAPDPGPGQKKQ